jgi:hypothetical protein
MEAFDHILNWKLKEGSHPFPSKDGGTCINEAALVAAGFEYRPIRCPSEMPQCFSRPICNLAMWLNDFAMDHDRQRLLPYVTRLACADSPEIEEARGAFINARTRYRLSFQSGLKILDGALAIGRHAEPFGADEVQARMDAAVQNRASPSVSVQTSPKFAKIKGWLGLTQRTAPVS